MIVLCHNCHNQYHQNKGVTDEDISDRKRHLIQNTLTQYGVNALKIADRNKFGVVAMPFLLHHLVDLGYMVQKEAQMGYGIERGEHYLWNHSDQGVGETESVLVVNARFSITEKGHELVKTWLM